MKHGMSPEEALRRNAINWFGVLGGDRVGVIFDPVHPVGDIYVDGKTSCDYVLELGRGRVAAIENVSNVLLRLNCLNHIPEPELKAACTIIACLTGLDRAVGQNDVFVFPGEDASALQCEYGMQFACDLPRFDVVERRITFFAVESMYTGEFDARLYRVEIDLKRWLAQITMTACTFQWPSPVPFDGRWVPISELDSLWIPDMRTGPPFNGTGDSKRSTPEKFTS